MNNFKITLIILIIILTGHMCFAGTIDIYHTQRFHKPISFLDSGEIQLDTTDFNNNLSSSDDTLIKALNTLDDMNNGTTETIVGQTSEVSIKPSVDDWYVYNKYGNKIGDNTKVLYVDNEYNHLYVFNNKGKFWDIPLQRFNRAIFPLNDGWDDKYILASPLVYDWGVSIDRITNVELDDGSGWKQCTYYTNEIPISGDSNAGKLSDVYVTPSNDTLVRYNFVTNRESYVLYNKFVTNSSDGVNVGKVITGTYSFGGATTLEVTTAWGLFRGATADPTNLTNYGVGFYQTSNEVYFVSGGSISYICTTDYTSTYTWSIGTSGLNPSVSLAFGSSGVGRLTWNNARGSGDVTPIGDEWMHTYSSNITVGITSDYSCFIIEDFDNDSVNITVQGRGSEGLGSSYSLFGVWNDYNGSDSYPSEWKKCADVELNGTEAQYYVYMGQQYTGNVKVGHYQASQLSTLIDMWNYGSIGLRIQYPTTESKYVQMIIIDSDYNPWQ